MENIKLLTDAACDLPIVYAKQHSIEMIPIAISIDGKDYEEGQLDNPLEFYSILKSAKNIPTTSQITVYQFMQYFKKAYEEGYTHILGVFLPEFASRTYQNAILAKKEFYEENPEAKEFIIEIPDSGTYSLGYGYPIAAAAQMVKEGKKFEEILQFVKTWLDELEIYFSMYTLEFARKSGRIGTVSAVIGEALGLKPIVCIKNGKVSTYKKVRGNKAVVKELARIAEAKMKQGSIYAILKGENEEPINILETLMEGITGYKAFGTFYSGPAVTINSGPEVIGIGFRGKN